VSRRERDPPARRSRRCRASPSGHPIADIIHTFEISTQACAGDTPSTLLIDPYPMWVRSPMSNNRARHLPLTNDTTTRRTVRERSENSFRLPFGNAERGNEQAWDVPTGKIPAF
jgi:hypothetical protein